MPIDPMFTESLFGTFRNMVEDCKQKNITGEDFDAMCSILERMEALGQEHSDFNAFNGQVAQENLYGRFSDHYSRALGAHSKQEYASGEKSYSDSDLLKSVLDGLRQAVQQLRDSYCDTLEAASGKNAEALHQKSIEFAKRNVSDKVFEASGGFDNFKKVADKEVSETLKKTPLAYNNTAEVEVLQNPEPLIKPIEDLIALGEQQGMTLPRFLRLQIEQGLDKAMEGAAVTRNSYVTELEFARALPSNPFAIMQAEEKIKIFDVLAEQNKFHVPVSKQLRYAVDDIFRKYEPQIIKWNRTRDIFDKLIYDLYLWSLSYCPIAPWIFPWSTSDNPKEAVITTQNTRPGVFREREKLLKKNFGLDFTEIFSHEVFKWDVEHYYYSYSQVLTEFLARKIFPACIPLQHLPSALIDERAALYQDQLELNPELHKASEHFRDFYDQKFGAGRYLQKFGEIEKSTSKAPVWEWGSFNIK